MLLVVDVGNTHVVLGVYKEKQLLNHWRIKTDRDHTADELAVMLNGLLAMDNLILRDISGIIVACVVPPMAPAWERLAKGLGLPPLFVNDPRLRLSMQVLIDHPEELGADRLVNAVAAYERYHTALIVVDFGTATTFDCISEDGAYLGGAIVPGITISLDALFQRAAKLPRVDISKPPRTVIGKNTVDAIKSGVLYGYAGLVDGLVTRIRAELAPALPRVIATGGLAELISPYTDSIQETIPLLTLEGLQLIHEHNN